MNLTRDRIESLVGSYGWSLLGISRMAGVACANEEAVVSEHC